MNADRRSHERKQPERMVFCKLDGEEGGAVLNLSEDGLCFENLTPIEERDSWHLRLSVDLSSAVEATGKLAWIDSAKRTGGLRFLELSEPAREQIRAWLSEAPAVEAAEVKQESQMGLVRREEGAAAASGNSSGKTWRTFLRKGEKRGDDKALAAEKVVVWQEMHAPSMQLVPMERHRSEARWQFVRGVLVGFGVCALMTIVVLRYSGGVRLSSAGQASASGKAAEQSRAEQPQTFAAPVTSARPLSPEPTSAKTPPAETKAVKTAYATSGTEARRQNAQAPKASFVNSVTRTPALATPQQATAKSPSAISQPQPLSGSQAAGVSAQAAWEARSSADTAQRVRKVSATPQQLWSAVQAGNMKAAVELAGLYTRGEGVPVNCDQARVLLLVASEKNNKEAPKKLQELDKGGCPANSQ
jgi:PilZ domain